MAQYLEPHEPPADVNEYFIEQLCAIAVGGLLVAVTFKWYFGGGLINFIALNLYPIVLGGGIGLGALVLFRGIVVWREAGTPPVQTLAGPDRHHGHAHGEEHHHEHGHSHGITSAPHGHPHGISVSPHGHSHGHSHGGAGHDHAWAPWRYMVMLVPIILGFLGLPAGGPQPYPGDEPDTDTALYSTLQVAMMVGNGMDGGVLEAAFTASVPSNDFLRADPFGYTGKYEEMSFTTLENARMTLEQRKHYTGRGIRITGQFIGSDSDRSFALTRYKSQCCGADAIPLNARIVIDYSQYPEARMDPQKLRGKWVEVSGVLRFADRGHGSYMPMIIVKPTKAKPLDEVVKPIPVPSNPYVT